MSQRPSSQFPEDIPNVQFTLPGELQAVQLLYKCVMTAESRNCYNMEEIVAMYPSILVVRKLLKASMEKQEQEKEKARVDAEAASSKATADDGNKTVTLAPTVQSKKTNVVNDNRVV